MHHIWGNWHSGLVSCTQNWIALGQNPTDEALWPNLCQGWDPWWWWRLLVAFRTNFDTVINIRWVKLPPCQWHRFGLWRDQMADKKQSISVATLICGLDLELNWIMLTWTSVPFSVLWLSSMFKYCCAQAYFPNVEFVLTPI